ncbi:4-azaleucine resistance transporter AzlC [Lipingzhangella halophila]|uniref:4-azaleucine resistance transporter AzlC n=1 Tax=Lipingzhangella halophila TaxID=1783352 RepID=A0A7W7RGR1_9ACTN|nr:AzlC family ABC transporter permease [Lipingzhangella halophila]MBB4931674.1 4-azaleucine resistance transporter AzlC [Lipingzhangella halophila]
MTESGPGADLKRALNDSGPVGLGAFPMGVAFGVLVAHSELAWWWASIFSGFIYAGSLEFLFLGLVTASAPLTSVAVTAFLVNARHVFYALSFPLHRVRGRLGKAYSTFALSDEAYTVTTGPAAQRYPGRRILGLQVFIHLYWAGGATTGALLGSTIPAHITGLDFAVTALFTVLAIDAFRGRRDIGTVVLAVVCALLCRFVVPAQMLLAAFTLFIAGLLAHYAWTRRKAAHA